MSIRPDLISTVERKEEIYWQEIAAKNNAVEPTDPRFRNAWIEEAKKYQEIYFDEAVFHLTVEKIHSLPGRFRSDWDKEASHYLVRIVSGDDEENSYTTTYSTGSAIREWPKAKDIFESALLDSNAGSLSYKTFCFEFGYNPELISSQKIWQQCVDVHNWFEDIGYTETQISNWADQLLNSQE